MTRPTWLPPWTDLLLAAVFVTLVSLEPFTGQATLAGPQHVVFAVPAMAALALRSRFPILVSVAVVAGNFLVNDAGQSSTVLALPFAIYSVGAMADRSRSRFGLGVLAVLFLAPFLAPVAVPWLEVTAPEPSDLAAAVVFVAGPWLVGALVRRRDLATREALQRAELLEREKQLEGELAAARERVRLARELHDVVSHSISVIAVQAQAVRRRLGDDHQREADDLRAVEDTAREAMAELRRLFGVLRSDDGDLALAPQPGLGELDRLVEQVRGTGLEVRLQHDRDDAPLQPGVDLAAYRIVQEALTNVIRHAGATSVVVAIEQNGDALHLRIEDDGRGISSGSTTPAARNGGHGLAGIRERAQLYGGTLEVGTSAAGGVRLSARLPLNAVPA